jgi:hypothetical protein
MMSFVSANFGGPGLVGYECSKCVYVTSVLLEPQTRGTLMLEIALGYGMREWTFRRDHRGGVAFLGAKPRG